MRDDDGQQGPGGRLKLVLAAVIGVILVAAIGYVVGSRAVPQNNLYSADHGSNVAVDLGDDNGAIPTYSGPPPADQSVNQMAAAVPVLPKTPPAPPPDPMAGSMATDEAPVYPGPAQDAGPPPGDADRQGRQEIGDAIQSATQDALDRGGSVRWHKDGLSGFAIAGAAVSDGGMTCRNAYSTTVRDGGQTRTSPVRWCRTGDSGPWAAQ